MLRITLLSLLFSIGAHALDRIEGYKDFKFGQSIDLVKRELSNSRTGYITFAVSSPSADVTALLDTLDKLKSKLDPMEKSKYKIRTGDSGTIDFARFSLCNSDQSIYEMMSIGYPLIDNDSIRFVVDTVNSVRFVFVQKKLRMITKLNPEKHTLKKVTRILEEKYGSLRFENNLCVYRKPNRSVSHVYNVSINQPTGQARMIVLSDYQQNDASPIRSEMQSDSLVSRVISNGLKVGISEMIGVSYVDPKLVEEMQKQWDSIVSDYLEIKREIQIRQNQMDADGY